MRFEQGLNLVWGGVVKTSQHMVDSSSHREASVVLPSVVTFTERFTIGRLSKCLGTQVVRAQTGNGAEVFQESRCVPLKPLFVRNMQNVGISIRPKVLQQYRALLFQSRREMRGPAGVLGLTEPFNRFSKGLLQS